MSDQHSGDRGPVVITGTSTGIGAASAIHLAQKGFRVFAGVRRTADGEALKARASNDLMPVIIDITDHATLSAAVDTVGKAVGTRGLAGLVNNAASSSPGPSISSRSRTSGCSSR